MGKRGNRKMKKVLIIGAGPAGLTAAYELLHRAKGEYEVIVFEESSDMGGISRTVNYKGKKQPQNPLK